MHGRWETINRKRSEASTFKSFPTLMPRQAVLVYHLPLNALIYFRVRAGRKIKELGNNSASVCVFGC